VKSIFEYKTTTKFCALQPESPALPMLVVCLLWTIYAVASPRTFNHTSTIANQTSTEPDTPDTRSLVSLIWSCIAVIISCTWTAVHPNIPDPQDSSRTIRLRKFKICLLAIAAPEWMVMWALRQLFHARRIRNMYNERNPGDTSKRQEDELVCL
jgi:hypothetical protein